MEILISAETRFRIEKFILPLGGGVVLFVGVCLFVCMRNENVLLF